MNNPTEQQPRTVEEAEAIIETYESLQRLAASNDFKKVFTDHLFTNEVIRLHSLMAHPEQSIVDSRDKIIADLDAISNIKFSLQMISAIGKSTKEQLEDFRSAQFEADEEERQEAGA